MRYIENGIITKADMVDFIDWLTGKPPAATYNYVLPRECLITQYLQARGFEGVHCDPFNFGTSISYGSIPQPLNDIAFGPRNTSGIMTYGEALQRAEAALATLI